METKRGRARVTTTHHVEAYGGFQFGNGVMGMIAEGIRKDRRRDTHADQCRYACVRLGADSGAGKGFFRSHPAAGTSTCHGDEVALGAKTLRSLELSVGDSVQIYGRATTLRMACPGAYVRPGGDVLNDGALLTVEGFRDLIGDPSRAWVRIKFTPGISRKAAADDLGTTVVGDRPPETPSSVDALGEVGSSPQALGVVLGLLGVAAASYSLVSTLRRRRADLAVLRALGFVRSQIRATLRWQAATVAIVGLVLGLPLGIALARQLWARVAEELGVVYRREVPLPMIALAVPVTLAIAVLLATSPWNCRRP